jgi:hypothetical protein
MRTSIKTYSAFKEQYSLALSLEHSAQAGFEALQLMRGRNIGLDTFIYAMLCPYNFEDRLFDALTYIDLETNFFFAV